MATRHAWVLNLDSDAELARPLGYHPNARVSGLVKQFQQRVASLIGPSDVVLPDTPLKRPSYRDYVGRAWCPTPRALHLLKQSGAEVPATPTLECLRRVAARRFCAELGQNLEHALFHETLETLLTSICNQAPRGGSVIKRNFGFSGRGQRRLSALPSADDRRWLEQAFTLGGVQFEPLVEITAEYAIHGLLDQTGSVSFGAITGQHTDAQGAWLTSFQINSGDLDASFQLRLRESAERVARALHAEAYFGPFGIDAYTYRSPSGGIEFNPKSDVNPRYTMGYSVGMHGG
jgi:hypothetical protein